MSTLHKLQIALAGVTIGISGCATPGPHIVTQVVKVPTPVACAIDAGPDPIYVWTPQAVEAAPSLYALGMLLWADRLQRVAREGELKAALEGCRG